MNAKSLLLVVMMTNGALSEDRALVGESMSHATSPESFAPIKPGDEFGAIAGWASRNKQALIFWIFQTTFWLVVGLLVLLLVHVFHPMDYEVAFVGMRVAIGFTATSLLAYGLQHPLFLRQERVARVLMVILACIFIVAIEQSALTLVAQHLKIFQDLQQTIQHRALMAGRLFIIGMWISLYYLLRLLQDYSVALVRASRAEAESSAYELKYLQAQLNPHFLFNSLNAIVANKDSPEDVEMVTQNLSSFLRFSLRETRPLEQLARELDIIQHYLVVQKSRFGEHLQCSITCDVAARAVRVPPMMIQPLLENAIHYGSMTCEGKLRVRLNAGVDQSHLKISVTNNGLWVSPDVNRSPGSAHRNLRKRLNLLLGEETRLDVSTEGGDVCVTVMIPLSGGRTVLATGKK
ncbi:MAG: histidine kinase [Verrucomicrobiota bacterium]